MTHDPARSKSARLRDFGGRLALVAIVTGGGLWSTTHGIAGASWSEVADTIGTVTPEHLALLAAIWIGGLIIYATVLAAALPGLGIRRGLLLNLTGSAISNVLPLGGAAGTALNWRMIRSWGHSDQAFASYFVMTNALDVLSKLLLPLVAVAGLAALSTHVPTALWVVACGCAAALLAAAVLTKWVHAGSDHAPRSHRRGWIAWQSVEEAITVITQLPTRLVHRWPQLLPASFAYLAAQVLLLLVSLRSVGLQVPLAVVLMAAAIERLTSLIPLTPSGAGIAELGTVAWLVASGQPPVPVVAGVLLYRVFLVMLEVPVGGALLAGWVWLNRRATIAGTAITARVS